ncbi:MAG: hypothetical protein ABL923_06635 [Burkholderiaceae bacterium]
MTTQTVPQAQSTAQLQANLNTKLARLGARMTMLSTVEGFAAFQQLDEAQQFAMLCDQADAVTQCLTISDAIEEL